MSSTDSSQDSGGEQVANQDLLWAYLDTNALVEFKSPEQNDWNGLLAAPNVVLVVAHVVVEELQHLKDMGANLPRRKRERAGEVLKNLERMLFPDARSQASKIRLRPGVELEYDLAAPLASVFSSYGLDDRQRDGRLVAAVVAAKDRGRRVCLVSNDAGPRWLAKGLGIPAHDLLENWRLPAQPDPLEIENRELKEQLAKYENRAPKLSVAFSGGASHHEWSLPRRRWPLEEHVERFLAALKEKHRVSDAENEVESFVAVLGVGLERITTEQRRSYEKELDRFLEKANRALPAMFEHQNQLDLFVPIPLRLANDGTTPAEKVKVVIRPAPPVTVAAKVPDGGPTLPEPPTKPRPVLETVRENLYPIDRYSNALATFPRVPISIRSVEWNVVGGRAELVLSALRHATDRVLPELFFVMPSHDEASSFHFNYALHAYNVPQPITGKLHVKVAKGEQLSDLYFSKRND